MKYIITQSRLLYVLSINDRKHSGLLKVGEVFVDNEVADNPDRQVLGKAVREILDNRSYMKDYDYHVEYVESTTYDQFTKCYKADDIYRTLTSMDIPSVSLATYKGESADIWFRCFLAEIQEAIRKVKNGQGAGFGPIKFRPEQEKAIKDTVDHFKLKTGKHFLWNAKMRFGKTISGLEVALRMEYKSTLIITHRPVVDKGWSDDFNKVFRNKKDPNHYRPEYHYANRMSDDEGEGGNFYSLIQSVDEGKKRLVFFVSMQYLRLSQFVGGKEKHFDPLKKAIMEYDWDFVMVDEAHEGIDAAAGDRVMKKLRKENTRILSLSGTPFNLLDKYDEGEIYTWDYVMEQRAKQEWDDKHYGDPNPYAELPRMQILTFTLPKMIRDEAIGNNEIFRFHEFFRVWTEEDKKDMQKQIDKETSALKRADMQAQMAEMKVGHFVYEGAVIRFLDKLVEESATSQYPFSTDEFRENFRHTFWLLPGVKEAAALYELLRVHDVFGEENGMFHIVNVAGDGNIEDKDGSALKEVQEAIKQYEYTITLSCGKLTTGVSVPEWTAVLCMKGSENTPAANYMQTIFRVQTHAVLEGRQKSDCYVFDFAPDRALTAVAETAKMAVYAQGEKGKRQLKLTQKKEEEHLGAFIKLCPVLSMDEGEMGKKFTANQIFEKLSNVYIERAVRSGYADNSLYNPDTLLNLTPEQEKVLGDVHDLLGSMPNLWKPDKINLNDNGLGKGDDANFVKYIFYITDKNIVPARPRMSAESDDNNKPTSDDEGWSDVMTAPSPLFKYLFVSSSRKVDGQWTDFSVPIIWKEYKDTTGDDDKDKKARDKENQEKRARMSVLRGVAIRIPLLVYGAEINDEAGEEITIDNFADENIVDQASWEEFMPKGFTKEMFRILKDCFDRSIFTGAAKRIRQMVKEADHLSTEDRIDKIATIFSYFHNPDKETVLTPWRVVNMQLSDCLGGWCFFNEEFDGPYIVENEFGEFIHSTRFVDRGDVTKNIFTDYNARILEINSKTGLYPLYMAYSMFRGIKEPEFRKIALTNTRGKARNYDQYTTQAENDLEIWKDVLQDNIFVICRTKMAVSITKRTLAGFRKGIRMNIKCYEREVSVNDLISSGVVKKTDEGVTKQDKTYLLNGEDFAFCDMIDVLRAKPELFRQDIILGKKFWGVYNSIPTNNNEDLDNMKFKAIVGNPPYQTSSAGDVNRTNAIYHLFIDNATELSPKYVSLITPSRWLTKGAQSIPEPWVDKMINSNHFVSFFDFPDSRMCFDTVEIKGGVSYFLFSPDHIGQCCYSVRTKESTETTNCYLNSLGAGIVIRDIFAQDIILKVAAVEGEYFNGNNFSSMVSSQHFFGKDKILGTAWNGYLTEPDSEHNIKYYLNRNLEKSGIGWIKKDDIQRNFETVQMNKIYISKASGSGNDPYVISTPMYGEPGSVCSLTYLVIGFDPIKHNYSKEECLNIISYMKTKFFRYMVSIKKKTQDAMSSVFQFVPLQNFSHPWTDSDLFTKYKLSPEEIAYIDKLIKPME